jgi:predicted MFS family arabinose efflux permease
MTQYADKKTTHSERLWNKNYIILILVNIFFAFSFNMVSTILSKYLVQLGMALTATGVVLGIFSITALIIRPISGVAADRLNKKNILIISNLLIGFSVLGYTVSDSVTVIMLFRILHGIGFGMSGTASIALASEIIPKNRTGEGIGYVGLGQILAVAVAPGLGIMVADQLGYGATFVTSFILAMIASFLLLFFRSDSSATREKPSVSAKISFNQLIAKDVLIFAIISGVMSFNNGIVNAYILLFSDQLNIGNISAYFFVSAVVMLIIRPLSGRVMDTKGLSVVVYPAFVIGIIAMVFHGLSTSLWMLLVAVVLKSIAGASIQASLLAESIRRAGENRSGVATSTFYIGADVGQGIGPMIGGMIATAFGYNVMFYFCGLVTLLGGLLFLANMVMEKKKASCLKESPARGTIV